MKQQSNDNQRRYKTEAREICWNLVTVFDFLPILSNTITYKPQGCPSFFRQTADQKP